MYISAIKGVIQMSELRKKLYDMCDKTKTRRRVLINYNEYC